MRGILLVACAVVALWLSSSARAAVTDNEVQAAIDRGVAFLLSQQKPNGWFSDTGEMRWDPASRPIQGAEETMTMLGLTFAEVDLKKSDPMKKGFEALLARDLDQVYSVAPRIMVIARLWPKLDREFRERVKPIMERDLAWLIKAQGAEGQWSYSSLEGKTSPVGGWDFSNTQMAVLALAEAVAAGWELPEEPFARVQKLYLEKQISDGGWDYGRPGFNAPGNATTSYGSMTAAAVASLYLTRDYLYRNIGCPCARGSSKLRPQQVDQAIDRGLKWLGKEFLVDTNPKGVPNRWTLYWLYSCERVGLAAGLKYFGAHNWYGEGAEYLVRAQARNGSWTIGGEGLSDTAYALCFLIKGRAPILFNKLQFAGQWDNHPHDMANLTQHVAHMKEQPIQWQVINLEAPVEEWHDAPILYLSAESIPALTDEHKKKLRRFTDTGGTILFEASCGNRPVAVWWERTCKEIWPEWELKALDKEHPVYSSDVKIVRSLPRMLVMDDGLRTIVFYSPTDVSCAWNTMAVTNRRELFDFGSNLFAYTTDKRPLRSRLARVEKVAGQAYGQTAPVPGGKARLAVARVKHGGDYYVGTNYDGLGIAAKAMQDRCRLTLAAVGEKQPSELKVEEVQVAWLTGRQGVSLSAAELKSLADYLKAGGFLLAEAALGDKRFCSALLPLLKEMGAEVKPIAADDGLLTGKMDGATGYAIKTVKFKLALRPERIGNAVPELFGIYLGGKRVGIYSPFDLVYAQTGYDAWGSRGYDAEDAQAILANLLLLASSR